MKKNKKRLGKVVIDLGYVVDLDNAEMVEHAKNCMYDDITEAVKSNEIYSWVKIVKDPTAKESDIPEFLTEDIDNEILIQDKMIRDRNREANEQY